MYNRTLLAWVISSITHLKYYVLQTPTQGFHRSVRSISPDFPLQLSLVVITLAGNLLKVTRNNIIPLQLTINFLSIPPDILRYKMH
jgi:hypothetical protein